VTCRYVGAGFERALAPRGARCRIALQLTGSGVTVWQVADAAAVEMGEPAPAGDGGGEVDADVV
jgi:hypothetical protein